MLKVRRAKRTDLSFVYDCICDLEDTQFNRATFKKIFLANLSKKDNVYLIATNTTAVGFLSCHIQPLLHHCTRVGEVQEMYVVPDARSHGVGKALLDALQNAVRTKKVEQIEVVSNVKRKRTHQFYLSRGFTFTSKKFVLKLD